MSATGNTTSPADPAHRASRAPSNGPVIAVVLCHCLDQPHREGEVALLDPRSGLSFCVGRTGVHFFQQRPGVMIDHGPLEGIRISSEQLIFTPEHDGVRVHNVGKAYITVDGTHLPIGMSAFVRPGAVIEVLQHSILLVTRRPRALPAPHPLLLPLQPYAEADSMGFAGESPEAWQQREDTVVAAESGRHVAVYGESGTGKDLVAQAIHTKSRRAGGPYVKLNAPNLGSELGALSLFGGRKNWPNPGTPETLGYFQSAEGGTLLLDELGEVSEAQQANLMRALQGGYNRMGETHTRPTRCVVVIATNRGEAGLKPDLRMRLDKIIVTPSLAQRREDIVPLARLLLLARAAEDEALAAKIVKTDAEGRRNVPLDPSFVLGLLRCPLRGNVRELDILLGMSVDQARGELPLRWPAKLVPPPPARLELREEAAHYSANELLNTLGSPRDEPQRAPSLPAPAPFGSAESPDPSRELLLQTLRETGWSFTRAASILNISRDKLYRLRVKYGLERPI